MLDFSKVKAVDEQIYDAMMDELRRQQQHIELIASENFVSEAVMSAMGSHLTNKYAEGYPGKRYYGGCEFVDVAEQLAIDRAKELFGAEFANVQAHSGAQANTAVYFAMLEPGDTIPWHEPCTRRAPNARQPGEHLRQIFSYRAVWCAQRHRADRL